MSRLDVATAFISVSALGLVYASIIESVEGVAIAGVVLVGAIIIGSWLPKPPT